MLTSQFTSVSVNVILTVRKLLSMLISIVIFGNPFNLLHAAGTAMVFGATMVYTAESSKKPKKA